MSKGPKVTAYWLFKRHACESERMRFAQEYPVAGAEVTAENLYKAREKDFDTCWLVKKMPFTAQRRYGQLCRLADERREVLRDRAISQRQDRIEEARAERHQTDYRRLLQHFEDTREVCTFGVLAEVVARTARLREKDDVEFERVKQAA